MRGFVLVGLAAAAAPALGQVQIADGTFNDTDWTHLVLYSRGAVTLGPMMQEASGGNPGAFQHGRHTTNGSFASMYRKKVRPPCDTSSPLWMLPWIRSITS
jgi:hypothetical protein